MQRVVEESTLESGQPASEPWFCSVNLGILREFLFIPLSFSFLISEMESLMPTSQIVQL